MANQPTKTQSGALSLASLVATAKPAKLVGARSTTPKTTETQPLVKTCEPQLLGPMPITMVKQVVADIRYSAEQLNYGVKAQVQDLDGVKIPQSDVADFLENSPTVQVNVAFQGSEVRKVINRKAKTDAGK
jgi:hypothetical protein